MIYVSRYTFFIPARTHTGKGLFRGSRRSYSSSGQAGRRTLERTAEHSSKSAHLFSAHPPVIGRGGGAEPGRAAPSGRAAGEWDLSVPRVELPAYCMGLGLTMRGSGLDSGASEVPGPVAGMPCPAAHGRALPGPRLVVTRPPLPQAPTNLRTVLLE